MKRSAPTIQELLAFDAVARHGSMTRAAGALCMTVSGISKQLAGIEQFVGHALLAKSGRGVQLTPVGRSYWLRIAPALRAIETATFEARSGGSDAGVLHLASVPTFLTKWLIPRLPAFRLAQPGVTFSFSQHLGQADVQPPGIDAAIRYGDGHWAGVQADYVAGREYACIVEPARLARMRRAEDVLADTLLHHEQAGGAWRLWAHRHGLDESATLAGARFAQYSAIVQAVVSGLGVGLVPRILVEDELARGALAAFGEVLTLEQGHYLCFDPARLERPVFAAFRAWVLEQGAAGAATPPGAA